MNRALRTHATKRKSLTDVIRVPEGDSRGGEERRMKQEIITKTLLKFSRSYKCMDSRSSVNELQTREIQEKPCFETK